MDTMERTFSFLDSLCSTYLSIQQARSPELFEGRGVVIPEAQVTAALSGQCNIEPWPDFEGYYGELLNELRKAEGRFAQICRRLELSDLEVFALLLAYAPEQNRKYERVFGYLQDNVSEKHATLGLAADLFSLVRPIQDAELFVLCSGEHKLNRYVLLGDAVGLARPLIMRESAVIYFGEAKHLGVTLKQVAALISGENCPEALTRHEEIDCCVRFAKNCLRRGCARTGLLSLYGQQGSGRRYYLQNIAAATDRDVLLLDCEPLALLDKERRAAVLDEAISFCGLHEAVPALLHFDFAGFSEAEQLSLAQELLSSFAGAGLPLAAICGERALKIRCENKFDLYRLELERHTIAEQEIFWREFSKSCALPLAPKTDSMSLANNFFLTPGQIRQVLSSADAACMASGEEGIGTAEISAAVRGLCRPRLSALTEPMEGCFTWDDLLLDESAMDTLKRVCERIRYRFRVNEEWGFDRKLPYGKGISVLLFGPPGTGKTMTAQVLAREFGMDAYRVDLSRIMDKYIGETEKKLGELFDAAKDSNAILFFDEAEALFSKRTEVSDSKDKYANAETAYLLQRMEQHNGISLLATNNMQNFDKAFKRRITFFISVEMPDAKTRLELWKKVFPAGAPLSPKLDLQLLADKAELTGSSIKSAALSAAYDAAAQECDITMEILRGCIIDEMKKNGQIVAEYELM